MGHQRNDTNVKYCLDDLEVNDWVDLDKLDQLSSTITQAKQTIVQQARSQDDDTTYIQSPVNLLEYLVPDLNDNAYFINDCEFLQFVNQQTTGLNSFDPIV